MRLLPSRLGYHKTVTRVEFLRGIDSKSDFEALLSIADLLVKFVKTTRPLLTSSRCVRRVGQPGKVAKDLVVWEDLIHRLIQPAGALPRM